MTGKASANIHGADNKITKDAHIYSVGSYSVPFLFARLCLSDKVGEISKYFSRRTDVERGSYITYRRISHSFI